MRDGERDSAPWERYYRVLREHAWIVAIAAILVLGATAAYVETATKQYRATAQLLIDPLPSVNTTAFDLPVLHSSADPTRDVLTAAGLITSPQVADAVIARLHLRETRETLLSRIQAIPIGQSNLIGVQAQQTSAAGAQLLANTFAQEVIATRTAALHAAVANIIPGLRSQVAALPASSRNGPGTLGDQLSQLQQLQQGSDPTISVASLADRPTSPSSPKTKLALIAGLIGGLMVGIGAAFAFNAIDPRLRREEQLRDMFGLPVMATIPHENLRKRNRPLLPEEMSMWAQEGYRTLRTVLVSGADGGPRAFLLTGSGPGEGKTTSAISLAAALALGGNRVLLIEADLRRPTIASAFGIDVVSGTEDVLSGAVALRDAVIDVDVADGNTMGVVAVRRPGVELSDLLSASVARDLIDQGKALADYVVLDSPPITAVVDALPLTYYVDAVLLVAHIGRSRLARLRELRNLLIDHGNYATGILLIGEQSDGGRYYYTTATESGQAGGATGVPAGLGRRRPG